MSSTRRPETPTEANQNIQQALANSAGIGGSGGVISASGIDFSSLRTVPGPVLRDEDIDEDEDESEEYDEGSDQELNDDEEFEIYLKQLCGQTGTRFDQLNLDEYAHCTNKNEVNKVFFSKIWADKDIPIEEKQKLEITTLFKVANPIRKIEQQIEENKNQASNRLRQHQEYIGRVVDLRRQLHNFQKVSADHYWESVKAVLDAGQWQLHKILTDRISFTLVNDCIIAWKDAKKSIDITVNLGKFQMDYYPQNNSIRINGFENNIEVEDYIHPHISEGSVCWGNASSAIENALYIYDIKELARVSFYLLHEYNSGSPYKPLTDFYEQQNYIVFPDVWVFNQYMRDSKIGFDGCARDSLNVKSKKSKLVHSVLLMRTYKSRKDDKMHIRHNGGYLELNPEWVWSEEKGHVNKFPGESK